MIDNTSWIFKNCPFQMLDVAFKKLFPGIEYEAHFRADLEDESGEKVYGLTLFCNDGTIEIFIDCNLSINDAVETFAHELAHVGIGAEHDHDEVWAKVYDDLFDEYNRLGDEMFGSNINAPSGEEYCNTLEEYKTKKERKNEMGNEKFAKLCKAAVVRYVNERLDKTDGVQITEENVFIVWICKTLQNNKALVSTTLPDGMYYELTYNGDKDELYLDAYKKVQNLCIKPSEFDLGGAV